MKSKILKSSASTSSMPKPPQRIGFIGLGVMGAPMASHLVRAGHAVCMFDARQGVAQKLATALNKATRAQGVQAPTAVAAQSLRELATRSDIIITMLPNGHVVQEVVTGRAAGVPNGDAPGADALLSHLARGSLLIDTSSSEPWLTRETATALEARGVAMVDAPVSGAAWGAQEANLVFMVGAAANDLRRVRPLLDCMGRSVHHLGPLGSGHAMKCINNLITAVSFVATAEGLAIGQAQGLDASAMVAVLNQSTGQSWLTQNHFPQRILSRSFDDPFKLELMLKDVGIANQLARDVGGAVALSALTQQIYQAADRLAGPGASVSELVRWVERQSGVEIGAKVGVNADIAPRTTAMVKTVRRAQHAKR
jgi:3-hydroxyisobutyrate dehydrogenase